MPNYFAFLVPVTIAEKVEAEIPDYAGLYVAEPKIIRGRSEILVGERIKSPRLHEGKIRANVEARFHRALSLRYVRNLIDRNLRA